RTVPRAGVVQADGRALPFPDASFDVALCNLVLLWTPQPATLVAELARVVKPGGTVLASMEPDYGGKVHFPENPLIDLVFQGEGVRRRGGDPHAGRKLRSHFVSAGLRAEVGIAASDVLTPEQDLAVFRRNRGYYRRLLAEAGFTSAAVDAWEAEYLESLSLGLQLSFLPLFYAIGRKPVAGDIDAA
ncbi:MAG TPA: methyltransferase domain-containing protein, partial [Candidatus Thermoplasmatota archaeon]|nr:methyltransferase domain-containing protein [Candidatus Thermoplasmatota archaeon]